MPNFHLLCDRNLDCLTRPSGPVFQLRIPIKGLQIKSIDRLILTGGKGTRPKYKPKHEERDPSHMCLGLLAFLGLPNFLSPLIYTWAEWQLTNVCIKGLYFNTEKEKLYCCYSKAKRLHLELNHFQSCIVCSHLKIANIQKYNTQVFEKRP
jgi:hypothetical protein